MPRPLNFREIEAFRAVMLTGTTTAAAAMMHTTQPSVSRLLGQVQNATELKLFDIDKGRLRPTQEARQLFLVVQRNFLGLERIEQQVASMRKSGSGTLRVGCTPSLGLAVMPSVITQFSQLYPDVHVNLQTTSMLQLREGLARGLYDVAITTTPFPRPEFSAETLHRSSAVCILPLGHPLAHRPAIHVKDLATQALMTLNADDEIHLQFQRAMEHHGLKIQSMLETTYSMTICAMAAQGAGIGIVNPYVATVFKHALHILPFQPELPVAVFMAFSSQTATSEITEKLAQLLKAHFSALPSLRAV